MTTYSTGNPIGSTSPKDLYDNAENFDELVNSQTKTSHPDRLGNPRKTWHGIETEWENFLANSGFMPANNGANDYDTDSPFTVNSFNEYVLHNGTAYRLNPEVATVPYGTTGVWADQQGDFVAMESGSLRQELADPAQGGSLVQVTTSTGEQTLEDALNSRSLYAFSIQALSGFPEASLSNGHSVNVSAYHPSPASDLTGGGTFVYQSSVPKSSHNGGTIISPTVPYDWSDNGVGYLSGAGETDPSGSGCFVRTKVSVANPLEFGAVDGAFGTNRDNYGDSSPSLNAALAFMKESPTRKCLDLMGRVYNISSPVGTSVTSGAIDGRRITNGGIQVRSDFSGGYVLDLSLVGAVSARTSFDNLRIRGGMPTQMPEAEGILKLPEMLTGNEGWRNTITMTMCEFQYFTGIGINGQAVGAATEALFHGTRIQGGYDQGAVSSVGIRWSGNDSEFSDLIIFNCKRCMLFESTASGNTIRGCHLWGGAGAGAFDDPRYLIDAANGRSFVITGNYLDNGTVRIDNPRTTIINDNKFVASQPIIDFWTQFGGAPITLRATVANHVIYGLSIQGNTFRNAVPNTTEYYPINIDQQVATFDVTQLHNTYVRNNSYDNRIVPMTTHPTKVVSVSTATQAVIDFGDIKFGPWHVLHATSISYQGNNTQYSLSGTQRVGSVFTVNMTGNVSGLIHVSGSSNTNAE